MEREGIGEGEAGEKECDNKNNGASVHRKVSA